MTQSQMMISLFAPQFGSRYATSTMATLPLAIFIMSARSLLEVLGGKPSYILRRNGFL